MRVENSRRRSEKKEKSLREFYEKKKELIGRNLRIVLEMKRFRESKGSDERRCEEEICEFFES